MTRFWIGFLNKFSGALQPPKLDQTEQDELIELLRKDQPWKKQEIQQLLNGEFNVEYQQNYLPTFLDELRLHYAISRTKRPDRPENAEEILDAMEIASMINGAIGEMVWAAEQYYSIDRHV